MNENHVAAIKEGMRRVVNESGGTGYALRYGSVYYSWAVRPEQHRPNPVL